MIKLTYVYDALCGWCYGFSPVITEFYQRHREEIELEVVSGGMITGPRIGPIGEVAPYIKTAYRTVEDRCGVTFGKGFLEGVLEQGATVFTSVPPAVALSVVKERSPADALDYAGVLQTAIYSDGIDPSDVTAYAVRAEKYGLDKDDFTAAMHEPKYREAAGRDFAKSAALGVTGFPTLIAESDHQKYAIARGYVDDKTLDATWQALRQRVAG